MEKDDETTPVYVSEFDIPEFAPFKPPRTYSYNKNETQTNFNFDRTCYFCDKRADIILKCGISSCSKCAKLHANME